MDSKEYEAHLLIGRLSYLLARLEGEFFHIHPDFKKNGKTTSLAFSSILNEAVNLHESCFAGESNFFEKIIAWGKQQEWKWDEIEIRFTRWPVCETLRPFILKPNGELVIRGRSENNLVKHHGKLANLSSTLYASAAAWFLVLERAREEKIFVDETEVAQISKIFDCFELIDFSSLIHGISVCRPLVSKVEYLGIRGRSEIETAKIAYRSRYDKKYRGKQK